MAVPKLDETVAREGLEVRRELKNDRTRIGRLVHGDDEIVTSARGLGKARPEIELIAASGKIE